MNNYNFSKAPFEFVLIPASLSVIFLIIMILIYCSSLSKPAGFEILIPRMAESEGLRIDQMIAITAENVFYLNGKVVTLSELKKDLAKVDFSRRNISIRVDRHSSMGRVMDVWDLCRSLGNSHVHIVTDERN